MLLALPKSPTQNSLKQKYLNIMSNEQTSASRIDHSVAAIYMHERYDPSTYVNDVSILKLEKKVKIFKIYMGMR